MSGDGLAAAERARKQASVALSEVARVEGARPLMELALGGISFSLSPSGQQTVDFSSSWQGDPTHHR